MVTPVILAGGRGSRLWPLSQPSLPKPFILLPGQPATLFAQTLHRAAALQGASTPYILAQARHEYAIRGACRTASTQPRFLLEPEPRGTAPALCAAALALSREGDDAPMLVLPSDHLIGAGEAFAQTVESGRKLAEQGFLVTFSVTPSHAATGYGYLHHAGSIAGADDLFGIDRFVEKPDAAAAQGFLEEGGFAWNSGIFMFRPSVLLAALAGLEPAMVAACGTALEADGRDWRLTPGAFAAAKAISLDHAVMEKSANIATVLARFSWSDVGDWDAVHAAAPRDDDGNALSGKAAVSDGRDNLLHSEGPALVAIGISGMVAIATPEAVLLAPRARAQEVRDAAEHLKSVGSCKIPGLWHDDRPWGSFDTLRHGDGYRVKELCVNPGGILSLQRHRRRAEHWVCTAGKGRARIGDDWAPLKPGASVFVPQGAVHRLENTGEDVLRIIEVQIGAWTGEDDIERLEDIYGRA